MLATRRFALALAATLVCALLVTATASAQCTNCLGGVCGGYSGDCPGPHRFYHESAPRLRWSSSCSRPVAAPCALKHFGYYQPCWRPWPFHPDLSHCSAYPPHGPAVGHAGPHELAVPAAPVHGGYRFLPAPQHRTPYPGSVRY